jgi:energy-coupling factor transporter ATP-binding protein EcfA2
MADSKPNFGASLSRNWGRGSPIAEAPSTYHTDGPALEVSVWSSSGDVFWGSPNAETKIAPGFYRCGSSPRTGPFLERMTVKLDALIRLPDPTCDLLLGEFVRFWASSEKFTKLGLAVKRGMLLWGPPGSGKTSAVAQMAAHMVHEQEGVVIMASDPGLTSACLHMLRKIEPTRPLIVVYEDLDALVSNYGEPGYLAMLDGETQIAGVVNVATTNYPERLDPRFVDRPGRFDRVTFVDMPQAEAREAYIKAKAPDLDEVTRARWVKETEGLSIAHLRELIVATLALGDDGDETITRLQKMQEDFLDSQKPPEEDVFGRQTLAANKRVRGGSGIGFAR